MDACVRLFLHELLKGIEEARDPAIVLCLLKTASSLLSLQQTDDGDRGNPSADSSPKHIIELAEGCLKAARLEAPYEDSATAIRRAFFHASNFKLFGIALLYRVAPDWLACFPAKDVGPCFEAFFGAAPAATVLEILLPIVGPSLRAPHEKRVTGPPEVSSQVEEAAVLQAEGLLAARLLESGKSSLFAGACGLEGLSGVKEIALREGNGSDSPTRRTSLRSSLSGIVGLLVSVPDRVRQQAPALLRAPRFFIALVEQLLAAALECRPLARAVVAERPAALKHVPLRHVPDEDDGQSSWTLLFVGEVFTRLCRRGHAGIVAAGMIDTFSAAPSCDTDVAADAMWHDLSTSISDHAAIERLAEALLRGMVSRRVRDEQALSFLRALFGRLLHTSSLVRSTFSERLLLHTVLPMQCLRWLVALAQSSSASSGAHSALPSLPSSTDAKSTQNHFMPEDGKRMNGIGGDDLLVRMLSCAVATWASAEFVRAKPLEQQSYVSAALIMCVRKISQAQLESTPHLVKDFLEGTSIRLESPLLDVRLMGQRVAEAFSLVLDPSKPLLFEEGDQSPPDHKQRAASTWEGAWWDRHLAPETDSREGDASPAGMDGEEVGVREGGSEGVGEGMSSRLEAEGSGREAKEQKKRRRERRQRRRERLAAEEEDPDEVVVLGKGVRWGGGDLAAVDERREEASSSSDGESADDDLASESGSSEMSLEPYDLEDDVDEEEMRSKAPAQLRACAAALRNTKDSESAERALGVVEALVRAAPDELDDWSAELTQALVNMHASSIAVEGEEDRLEQQRHSALVALAVKSTLPSINVLVPAVYSPHVDMSQRLAVLDALADAARELATTPVDAANDRQVPFTGSLVEELEFHNAWWGPGQGGPSPGAGPWREAAAPAGSTALMNWAHKYERELRPKPGRPEVGRSRRWGRTARMGETGREHPPEPLSFKNRFAPVAAAFMLPLMKHYDRVSHGVDFLRRDFVVLGRLLWMLGVCMECCSGQPEAVPLAEALLELLLSRGIVSHEEPYVRRSALFAASRVLVALPPASVLMALASDDHTGLPASLELLQLWFSRAAGNDPDDECSKMASACLHLHGEMAMKALGSIGTASNRSGPESRGMRIQPSSQRGPLIQLL